MDKGRRQELERLKFKKRIKNLRLDPNKNPGNYHAFKHHGKPCSCFYCKGEKFRDKNRAKTNRQKIDEED